MIYRTNSTNSKVKLGEQKVLTALIEMPGLTNLVKSFNDQKPLKQKAILGCVTVTPQTAVFMFALRELGAELSWCSDNLFYSDPDVVAYLQDSGFKVFAEPNMPIELYYNYMQLAYEQLKDHPNVLIHDDGCDITKYIAKNYPSFLEKIHGITEQTTCGIVFLTHLYREKKIPCPTIDVAHGYLKRFDNHFGLQQSLLHGLTVIGISIASKKVTVIGFGSVGEGAAKALKSLGASVSIVEQDITKLARAYFEGFTPCSIEEALSTSDMIFSATGCFLTIPGEKIKQHAKDGLILGNIGHAQEEYDIIWLEQNCQKDIINQHRTVFTLPDGRAIHSLCEGAIVNFLAGGGNPSRELSLTFTAVALAQIELANSHKSNYEQAQIYPLSEDIERRCGELNFPELVPKLYQLSEQQRHYLALN